MENKKSSTIITIPSEIHVIQDLSSKINKLIKVMRNDEEETSEEQEKLLSELYLDRADAYFTIQRYRDSIKDYNNCLKYEPESSQVNGDKEKRKMLHFQLGSGYAEMGKNRKAISEYKKAIALDENFLDCINSLGIAYLNVDETDESLYWFDRAIEVNPKWSNAYDNRGILYENIEDYTKALENFNMAIELDPENHYAFSNRAYVYMLQGRYEMAYKDVVRALNIKCDFDDAFSVLRDIKKNVMKMLKGAASRNFYSNVFVDVENLVTENLLKEREEIRNQSKPSTQKGGEKSPEVEGKGKKRRIKVVVKKNKSVKRKNSDEDEENEPKKKRRRKNEK